MSFDTAFNFAPLRLCVSPLFRRFESHAKAWCGLKAATNFAGKLTPAEAQRRGGLVFSASPRLCGRIPNWKQRRTKNIHANVWDLCRAALQRRKGIQP